MVRRVLSLLLALAATRDIKLRSSPMPAESCPALPDPAGSPARLVPSILLIGERKCGSSSLARYLGLHSHVLPPKVKEPGYLMRPRSQLSLAEYSHYFARVPRRGNAEQLVGGMIRDDYGPGQLALFGSGEGQG